MKKLFLLLILSLFSIQGFAAGCPDGSEPVKSISADGTYFVYNCGNNSDNVSKSNNSATTKEKTQIEWVDGLYAKSITDEFNVLSKDFSKSVESGDSQILPLGSGDFSGDGIPEIVYGIQYWNLKKGSNIKPIFLTNTPGKGFSLFKPIMDIVPYTGAPRSSVIEDFNGDGVNDIFIADHGVDWEPYPGYQNSLILSAPNGKFINATSNLPQLLDFTHGVTSADIDSDGDIDLFVTQAGVEVNVPHYFLRNNGKGRFTKVPDGQLLDRDFSYISWKPDNKRRNFYYTPGLEFVDDDDKLDLILLSGKLEGDDNNRIIFGSNSGFKKSDALELQPGRFGKESAGYNYLLTDIDNDGDNDILILHVTRNLLIEPSHLGIDLQVLIQEKNRKFVDKSNFYFPGITFDYGTWNKSLNLIDINNDDKKDIVLLAMHGIDDPSKQQIGSQIPPKVFIRQDDGSFRPLNNDLLTGGEKYTLAGIRPIDIDNDGDIEFVAHKDFYKDSEKGFTLQVLELTTNKDESMYSTSEPIRSSNSSDSIISSPLYDGRYPFTLSRYNENDGSQPLGNGYIEINNGIMTVAKKGRALETGSIDLYDLFEGHIDKEGNIISSLKINALTHKTYLFLVDLNGNIDSPLQGEWDHYYDVILKLGEKQHTVYDGKYSIYLYASYRGKREKNIINATIEINNGLINNSDDSYKWIDRKAGVSLDTMKGTVDKEGNVNWSIRIDPWQKGKYLIDVIFKGNLNEDGSITGNYDDGTALRMKLNKID